MEKDSTNGLRQYSKLVGKSSRFSLNQASNKEFIENLKQMLIEAEIPVENPSGWLSVIIFRLGKEWLALPTIFCKEITRRRPVHSIPHRSGRVFQGIVNLNGELRLYIALHELLEIETSLEFQTSKMPYQRNRMMAILKDGELWAFPVDEVDGVYKWEVSQIEEMPLNVSRSGLNNTKGIFKLNGRKITLLDEELLFASLKRCL